MKNPKDIGLTLLKHIFLVFYALLALIPFLWVLMSAFKDNTGIFTQPFALPKSFELTNIISVWNAGNINVFFSNSLFVGFITLSLQLLFVSMATYFLVRVARVPLLSNYFLLGLMMPIQAMLIPNFLTIRSLNLMNSLWGVIMVYCATNTAFAIFLLSGYMRSIPHELEEAATIDGAGYVRIFFMIILPVSKPGLATVATFSFLHAWNELLFAMVILTRRAKMTLTQGINFLRGEYVTDYGLLCAGLLFAIIPVVIMYILLQEQVIKGMTAGAVKG